MCKICSKLTVKIPKQRHGCRSVVIIVNFDALSRPAFTCSMLTIETVEHGRIVLVSLLLTLNIFYTLF